MESFEKFCDKEENWFDIDRKGFQKWIEMDLEDQEPYLTKAKEVDAAYKKSVLKEMKEMEVKLPSSESCANYDKEPVCISYYSDESSDRW
ncbi:hypothetical protein ZOSMA_56G01310 [Zostera marina]|uniref:Uncharacterized protein n=1 Tax=Zostera marina TaxID=29655 RepID=A0A0K9NY88_ZOSMR|nr:hypothetical protein ZOSMA_56G01310 [Zostera marina]